MVAPMADARWGMNHPNDYKYCPYEGQRLTVDNLAAQVRPSCSKCGFVDYQNPKACVAILIAQGGRLLLAQRGIEPAKGQWDIPGGFVDSGESAEEAAVREALEEMTLTVRVAEYLGSVPDLYGPRQTPTLNLCFLVEILAGEPKAKSDVASLEWFPLDALPGPMAFAHQQEAIRLLKARLQS